MKNEAEMQQRLDEIGAHLDRLSDKQSPNAEKNLPKEFDPDTNSSASGKALQIGSDLIGGVVVGGLIGYLVDRLLQTKPVWFLIFLLLGMGAGLLNVLRSARLMQKEQDELVRQGRLNRGQDLPDSDEDD